MRKNRVLAKLREGKTAYGVFLNMGEPIIAEETAHAGFDWIFIDTQHGYFSETTLLTALQVINPTDTVALVRPAGNDPVLIGRALDCGAMGVVVPLVNTRAEAEKAVAATRYPPTGKRSAGGTRVLFYGADYIPAANSEIFLAVMLETAEAVRNADAILSVPGVDCGYIGPTDLGLDLGIQPGQNDRLEAAIQEILDAGKRCGVPVGIPCGNLERARQRVAQGFRFVDLGGDWGFFMGGLREAQKGLATL